MSNLQSRLSAVKFGPVPEPVPPPPGEPILLFGAIFPAAVIGLELISGMCANAFFDPLPTYWHALVAGLVPASNLLAWYYLQDSRQQGARWMAFLNGAAIPIAGFYTLLFLPLLPLAAVAIIVAIGLMPFAPLASFVCAIKLCGAMYREHQAQGLTRPLLGGLAVGLALLLVPDIPAGATRLGMQWAASSDPAQRERGLTLLRTLGDDDPLLRLCYGTAGRQTGLLSALVIFSGHNVFPPRPRRQLAQSPAEAREIYYRLHGVPFNSKPAPFDKSRRTGLADVRFDEDHGGTQVGGRAQGLQLVSSRIDGSVSGDDAVAYLEWTVEFRNSEPVPREARLQLALPPGGVVSRATLWVDGQEREAAYGGRSHVRAAYQRVAVQQRRDPLLVTSKGADRVLAQAFPVPAHGTIKFKLGISAPLDIVEPSKARLTLPALVDRNFTIGPDVSHSVWIESRQALATSMAGLPVSPSMAAPSASPAASATAISPARDKRSRSTATRSPAIARRGLAMAS